MRVSIREVARHASVSPKTVTNVLRGRGGEASPLTRERVLQAVQELGYVPVASPMQNRHVETRVIGVVFDEVDAATDYFGLMNFRGMRQGALESGYDLLVMLQPQPDWAVGRGEVRYLDRRTDGLIFIAPRKRTEVFQTLVANEIPVVTCHELDVPRGVVHVVGDNIGVARLATQHLIDCGHTRIAHYPGPLSKSYFQQRRSGYRQTMAAAGLEGWELPAQKEGVEAVDRTVIDELWLHKITAVVAGNDGVVLPLLHALRSAGVRVPQDISVIGGDNVPEAAAAGLTTVHLDMAVIGHEAINAMLELLQGRPAEKCHRTIPVHLVQRNTVTAPT